MRIKVTLYLYQGVCQSDVRKQRVYLSCVKCVYTVCFAVMSRNVAEVKPAEVSYCIFVT